MSNFTTEEIAQRYPTCLRENIRELVTKGIGLMKLAVQINLPPSKTKADYDQEYDNSVIVDVPYMGRHLRWEITFNDQDLTFAPDFYIVNDTFLDDPDVDLIEKQLPTLCNWNIEDPKSLTMFVEELYEVYKSDQLEKLLNNSKHVSLQKEFVQLKSQLALKSNDVEVFIEDNAQHFLIPLKLDYSDLPVYIQNTYFPDGIITDPGADRATLKISFYQRRKVTALQLSPRLEKLLGMHSSLHLPPYKNSSMAQYVQSIEGLLREQIEQVKKNFQKKEQYIAMLLSLHGDNVMEYDNIGFAKATFLFKVGTFACLGQICLSDRFPNEMPLVTLRSMYHKDASGTPASLALKSYPYNAGWKIEEIVDKLLKHIRNEMNRFKSHCINNLSQ